VKEIGYLGDQSVYLVQLDSGKTVRVTQSNLMRHADRVSWDERVYVHWHATSGVVLSE
jgi:putrescine transport system ATP-binding protein